MHRLQKFEWLLVLAATGLIGPANSWSSEKPAEVNQVIPTRSARPTSSVAVVQTGFATPSDLRYTMIDNCEDMGLLRSSNTYYRASSPRVGLGLRQTVTRIKTNEDNMIRWFYFIRGHGPANWQFP